MKIAIIGCGNMGKALASRLSKFHQLFFYDHHVEKALNLEHEGCGTACNDIKDALIKSEIIILAIKPQSLKHLTEMIKDKISDNQLLISLLAGITIETLQPYFPGVSIVRMMPNLPILCGEGVVGLSLSKIMKNQDKEQLTNIFESLGKLYWLPEEKIDALTALTGSGPAFFFAMIEAMVDAGVAMGFSDTDAKNLTYQMLKGSLTLLENSSKSPQELISQIASPQGTTIAGLKRLEELTVQESIKSAFCAAYDRAKTLSSI